MASIHLPTTLPLVYPGLPRAVDVDAATVDEAIERLDQRWPGLRARLARRRDRRDQRGLTLVGL